MPTPSLPIEDVLPQLQQHLNETDAVVLQAPPGAGKTTMVPLALIDAPWRAGRKILMLEPRRIAARTAAYRMASLLGEKPGQRVGYRMRLDTRVGADTVIEVITEGILTRMLQQDPTLEDVALVIFDEFHERSLDADLGLALSLKARELFATDADLPKLLLMSATLDHVALADLLGNAPVIHSEGRSYPVEIIHGKARESGERLEPRMLQTIKKALEDNPSSSVLAFLPGQAEIRRCHEALQQWQREQRLTGIHLHPLYGNLTIEQQQQAIAPLQGAQAGEQKVVLATNIAETSLTIDGIDVVVDSGLAREPFFNPATGMSGLHTVSISRASSVQRAGRAGRLRPGKCYRLWSEQQQQTLAPHSAAEILQADLAPLAMQLLQWGADNPDELSWLDPPPKGPWSQALSLLESLGAIEHRDSSRVLSHHGSSMAALPTHPRLAHMLIRGHQCRQDETACLLASLLAERDPFGAESADIGYRLELLRGDSPCPRRHQGWKKRCLDMARQFSSQLQRLELPSSSTAMLIPPNQLDGFLLACAYPDRVARRRHSGGYQLANGRSANFAREHQAMHTDWLTVAEISSVAGGRGDIIRSAARLEPALFEHALADLVNDNNIAEWDKKTQRFVAERQRRIGALVLEREALQQVPIEAKRGALIEHIRHNGLRLLPWDDGLQQWRARVNLLRSVEGGSLWPDLSDEALLADLEDWLAPYLDSVNTLQGFNKLKLGDILRAQLSWQQQQRLEQLAPTRLRVPSGSSLAIDYREQPPVLRVKLQEMFGCTETPSIADGKVELLIHLLSPAGRPLQVTQDLAGFWRSSYHEVKKDMKGRYPKHPWPDDPLNAEATRKTKPRK